MATTIRVPPGTRRAHEAAAAHPAIQDASSQNLLYYGDNLEVLRLHVTDASVDLVYLDPPFKSNQDYNVLFAEQSGERAAAQIKVFEDTWRWDESAQRAYQEVVERGGPVSQAMQAFRTFLGKTDMLAYLSMMAPRLVELKRVLKPTGSIYLHCDPTAGHYLKMLMDAVFTPQNYRSEIIWKRTSAHSSAHRYGPVHDTILLYSRSDNYVWNPQFQPYEQYYLDQFYTHVDRDGRRWRRSDITGAGIRRGETGRPWRGIDVTAKGRHWFLPPSELDKLDTAGKIHWPRKQHGMPMLRRYIDDQPGVPLQDVWTDIPPMHNLARERLGFPTQKPEALLARILMSSSNPGDTMLDPFCGCGTAIAVSQRLKRRWIGIDVTHLAVTLIKHRLQDAFGGSVDYKVIGEPISVPDAEDLAAQDPYQFQWWALGLVGARPTEEKKGADQGIDGRLYFHDEGAGGKTKQVIISVKAGHLVPAFVQQLRGVSQRENAEIGVLITMQQPTKGMRAEAAAAGFYTSAWGNHPLLQILTVAQLLSGRRIDYPPSAQVNQTFRKAPAVREKQAGELYLPLDLAPAKSAPAPVATLVDQEIAKQIVAVRTAKASTAAKASKSRSQPRRIKRGA